MFWAMYCLILILVSMFSAFSYQAVYQACDHHKSRLFHVETLGFSINCSPGQVVRHGIAGGACQSLVSHPPVLFRSVNQFYIEVILGEQEGNPVIVKGLAWLRRYDRDRSFLYQERYL